MLILSATEINLAFSHGDIGLSKESSTFQYKS
jgi:hypothetical protein